MQPIYKLLEYFYFENLFFPTIMHRADINHFKTPYLYLKYCCKVSVSINHNSCLTKLKERRNPTNINMHIMSKITNKK